FARVYRSEGLFSVQKVVESKHAVRTDSDVFVERKRSGIFAAVVNAAVYLKRSVYRSFVYCKRSLRNDKIVVVNKFRNSAFGKRYSDRSIVFALSSRPVYRIVDRLNRKYERGLIVSYPISRYRDF